MSIQPKIEPGSPSTSHIILDRDENETHLTETAHNLEEKTIPDLVEVLRVAYLPKTFDTVEAVLLSREKGLRDQIQLLQQNVEMEKLARLKAEEEVKKRERVSEEGKKLEQRYTTLLKELKKTDLAADRGTVDILRKRNVQLRELCEKGKRELQNYEAMLKEAEMTRLADRDALEEVKKKNVEFECEVKKLEEKRLEDENELKVLKSKNGELESRVMELKEKIFEDDNALDVLRKMKDGLEHQVLELKGKMVEDEKLLDVLKSKNGELENEVLEFRKLKEKWEEDTNELSGIREKNAELDNEVLELKKKWLNDSNALEELRSKVRLLEDDKKALADIEIKNGELKESVNNNLAIINKLKNENNNWYIKFYELVEKVAKMEDDTKLLMSVEAFGGGNNDGDATASTWSQNIRAKDAQGASSAHEENPTQKTSPIGGRASWLKYHIEPFDILDMRHPLRADIHSGIHSVGIVPPADPMVAEFGNDTVQAASLPRNEDAQPPNIRSKDGQGASLASGKKAISGIAMKNDHPTPSSSIAVEMAKRKHSIADSETSSSGSSCDLSYLNKRASRFVVSEAKKKKM